MTDLFGNTTSGAEISDCGTYRYKLWRRWNGDKPWLVFVLLNPSTADAAIDDPTIKRCMSRALDWGYGTLAVVNLMAYRATKPSDLKSLSRDFRTGPRNADALDWGLFQARTVIAGWGKLGKLGQVDHLISQAKRYGIPLYCLQRNEDGSPRHPLYVPYDAKPIWWGGAEDNRKMNAILPAALNHGGTEGR